MLQTVLVVDISDSMINAHEPLSSCFGAKETKQAAIMEDNDNLLSIWAGKLEALRGNADAVRVHQKWVLGLLKGSVVED